MSIQKIVDEATYIAIDKSKSAAQSISRSGKVKTAARAFGLPYRFTIGTHAGLTYSTNRDLLEAIDSADVVVEEEIDIGKTNTGLSYITAYQGTANAIQLANITVTSASNSNIVLNTSSVPGTPGGNLFVKGDFIQPKGNTNGYRYTYQVTSNVADHASTVTVPTHRAILEQDGVALAGAGINVGNDVTFHVKISNRPVYSIVPGDRIEFSDDFELVEIIT